MSTIFVSTCSINIAIYKRIEDPHLNNPVYIHIRMEKFLVGSTKGFTTEVNCKSSYQGGVGVVVNHTGQKI